MDAILAHLAMSTARLALAELTLEYQTREGAGYIDVVQDRTSGQYLSDRANHAENTQAGRPSLSVSLHHGSTKVEEAAYCLNWLAPGK